MKIAELCDLSVEISSVSMIIGGLSNQLGEDTDSLTIDSLKLALYGVSHYLDRIAKDIEDIDCILTKKGVTTHE